MPKLHSAGGSRAQDPGESQVTEHEERQLLKEAREERREALTDKEHGLAARRARIESGLTDVRWRAAEIDRLIEEIGAMNSRELTLRGKR
jgi:hypothetical protein